MKWLKRYKMFMMVLVDILLVNLSYIFAYNMMIIYGPEQLYEGYYLSNALIITSIYLGCFLLFKLYQTLLMYSAFDEFLLTTAGCLMGGVMQFTYEITIGPNLPYKVSILGGLLSMGLVVGFRLILRIYRHLMLQSSLLNASISKRVLVIGAGSAGTMTVSEMRRHPEMGYMPVGLIDDDRRKIGRVVAGVKVLGNRDAIQRIVFEKEVDEIIISIPSLRGDSKKELLKICNKTGRRIKILPGIYELIDGQVTLNQIRDVSVDDLLGRDSITLDCDGISEYIKDKTILITGGGGSIGSELCRQIARFQPGQMLILDFYENNAYDLANELLFGNESLSIKVIIASITDKRRMEKVFSEYRPEVVFHAAAHKHVPLMEDNASEAIKNNVFGTSNIAECADRFGTRKFVMISTDKAVNPTNVMGASKRICEMIIQAMDRQSSTEFVAVRFGNVLGSNGSVVPLFKWQIAHGGPVTVTDKEITRYFMTIPEAAQLVLQAGAYAEGGEIFILDMGQPVRIYDLACDLIKLSGLEPHKDIEIQITGLRPGEKLHEELCLDEEGLKTTNHRKIFVANPTYSDMEALKRSLDEMRFITENGTKEELLRAVQGLIPTYQRVEHTRLREMEKEKAGVDMEASAGAAYILRR